MLLPLLAFVFGSLLVTAITYALTTRKAGLNDRLRDVVGGLPPVDENNASNEQIVAFLKRIGERVPQNPGEMGKLQQRLVMAGYRSSEAVLVFLGIRVAFAMACCRLCTPSFSTTCCRWKCTVRSETPSNTPISHEVLPSAAQRRHSRSRAVSSGARSEAPTTRRSASCT